MEEDVKKCETLLGSERWVLGTQDKKAIGNLIKGYKDGEEIIKNTVKENLEYQKYIRELEENLKIATAMLTKGQYPEKNKGDNDFSKQFIPKSKIKEKIEECRRLKFKDERLDKVTIDFILNKIQELMEDK